ncbi:cytochrome P450 [Xylariaceae sp. FL1272]|nr:cytochrome P450 [Xylariaceae sp. FL1272]
MFLLLLAVLVTVLVCYRLFHYGTDTQHGQVQSQNPTFWATVPVVGVSRTGLVPWMRGAFLSTTQCYTHSCLGYEVYSKAAESVFAQPMMGIGAVVNIPVSQLHVLNKSESEVLTRKAQVEGLQPCYTTGDERIFDELIHFDVVRRFFRKNMVVMFIEPLNEELDIAFRKHWGTNTTSWTTVNIWDTSTKIMSQVASRIVFGPTLAANDDFTAHSSKFGRGLFGGSAFINALPSPLHPFLGPIIGYSARKHETACLKTLIPYLETRLQTMNEYGDSKDKPNDPVQWLLDESYAFAGCVLDLNCSESRNEFLEGLREEHNHVLDKHSGRINASAGLEDLHRLDSAIRESMRISTFPIISFMRTRIGVPSRAIHRDPDLYPSPCEYDAFRFSRPFETQAAGHITGPSRELLSTVTDSFLALGYGKHACPGRWFAAQYLKQALTEVISNYDVECVGKPWAKTAMFNMVLPPTGVRVRIRRRREQ